MNKIYFQFDIGVHFVFNKLSLYSYKIKNNLPTPFSKITAAIKYNAFQNSSSLILNYVASIVSVQR